MLVQLAYIFVQPHPPPPPYQTQQGSMYAFVTAGTVVHHAVRKHSLCETNERRSHGRERIGIRLSVATPSPPPPPASLPPNDPSWHVVGRKQLEECLKRVAVEARSGETELVLVMFHAKWCRVCKTLRQKLRQVEISYRNVKWVSVDIAEQENKHVSQELGVKMLPTFFLYTPGAQIEDTLERFVAGPFAVKRVKDNLERYLRR